MLCKKVCIAVVRDYVANKDTKPYDDVSFIGFYENHMYFSILLSVDFVLSKF